LAVEQLERLTDHYEEQYPHKNRVISRWKNYKLHQLSSAKSFLAHEAIEDCDLEGELAILQEERFFPELRQQAEELR
jgi:hypothetical protein